MGPESADQRTLSSFSQLSQYELFILCHTIPEEERLKIRAIATHQGIGLYQLERMEAPPRFIGKVADMVPPMGAGPS